MIAGEDRILAAAGVKRSDFDAMCGEYRAWNEKINVISRKDIDCVFEHHILHSLCIAACLAERFPEELAKWRGEVAEDADKPAGAVAPQSLVAQEGPVRVLDLGCGGGFPGIPLAFCFPGVEFTLCDSIGKKILVAGSVASALGLENVHTVCGRVEEQRGSWDWVVSRAVAPMDNLVKWTEGKFTRGMICLKGGGLDAEIAACRRVCRGKLHTDVWNISEILSDEYYSEKKIVTVSLR